MLENNKRMSNTARAALYLFGVVFAVMFALILVEILWHAL